MLALIRHSPGVRRGIEDSRVRRKMAAPNPDGAEREKRARSTAGRLAKSIGAMLESRMARPFVLLHAARSIITTPICRLSRK